MYRASPGGGASVLSSHFFCFFGGDGSFPRIMTKRLALSVSGTTVRDTMTKIIPNNRSPTPHRHVVLDKLWLVERLNSKDEHKWLFAFEIGR